MNEIELSMANHPTFFATEGGSEFQRLARILKSIIGVPVNDNFTVLGRLCIFLAEAGLLVGALYFMSVLGSSNRS